TTGTDRRRDLHVPPVLVNGCVGRIVEGETGDRSCKSRSHLLIEGCTQIHGVRRLIAGNSCCRGSRVDSCSALQLLKSPGRSRQRQAMAALPDRCDSNRSGIS
ncbi:hypothetical protein PENTCL1PPCAC_1441, partial [Pristionchus entomophagus]